VQRALPDREIQVDRALDIQETLVALEVEVEVLEV
jgi:hypothetical protein